MGNFISAPRRHEAAGKRIDQWEIRLPEPIDGKQHVTAEVRMHRNRDGDVFTFEAHIPELHINASSATLTDLHALTDELVKNKTLEGWKKYLKVKQGYASNTETSAELSIEWSVVYVKRIGKTTVYRSEDSAWCLSMDKKTKEFIEWTQQREDVLRQLCTALTAAHDRLGEIINEGQLEERLDSATLAGRLLTAGSTK